VAPASLINHGEDLEVDLIDPAGEMDVQSGTITAG